LILSNTEIHKALDERRLILTPEPTPRFPEQGKECPFQTSAVDLCLGAEILVPKPGRAFSINLAEGKFATLVSGDNYDTVRIAEETPYELKHGKFILAKTRETVELPIGEGESITLAARVEGRSSYARAGMMVHFTAPTVHAGYKGTITLEIINLGAANILLKPNKPICQLVIEEVKGRPFRNDSQFQGQTTPGGHGVSPIT
jgi:dCTP deaminase